MEEEEDEEEEEEEDDDDDDEEDEEEELSRPPSESLSERPGTRGGARGRISGSSFTAEEPLVCPEGLSEADKRDIFGLDETDSDDEAPLPELPPEQGPAPLSGMQQEPSGGEAAGLAYGLTYGLTTVVDHLPIGELPSISDFAPDRSFETWPSRGGGAADIEGVPPVAGKGPDGGARARPGLLGEIEMYVQEELHALGAYRSPRIGSEDRLHVFDTAMGMLIEGIPSVRGVLQGIREQYHIEIERGKELRAGEKMGPLRVELVTTEKLIQVEIHEMKLTIDVQDEAIGKVRAGLRDADEEKSSVIEIQRALQHEIVEWQLKAKADETARQKLHKENVDIINRDLKMDSSILTEKKISQVDCDFLRDLIIECQMEQIRLQGACEKLGGGRDPPYTTDDINAWMDDIRKVQASMQKMSSAAEEQTGAIVKRLEEANALCAQSIAVMEEKMAPRTPRPEEASYKEVFIEPCNNTQADLKSLMDLLIAVEDELSEVQNELPPELLSDSEEEEDSLWVLQEEFEGEGLEEEVPEYMRWEGKIKNRKIPKGSLEGNIKNFWKEKKYYDKKDPDKKSPPEEFFIQWAQKKYGREQRVVADWAYNMLDAALRFRSDADCEMWLNVMEGEYDEEMYWDEVKMLDSVMAAFNKEDMAVNKIVTGKLKKEVMIKTLRATLPLKTDVRFNRLKRTLAKEECAQGNIVVTFTSLRRTRMVIKVLSRKG